MTIMNETLKTLETRRSCRKFKPDMVSDEELDAIIRAGTFAPSGKNQQSSIIIAVTNKELRDQIAEENRKIGGWPEGFDPFYGAPVILIVIADKDANNASGTYINDGSLVMGNLMNAAASLGIQGNYEGIGHVALGYRQTEVPKALPRKENYVYYIR